VLAEINPGDFNKLHKDKEGTPTMGGVLIWFTVPALALFFWLLAVFFDGFWSKIDFFSRGPEVGEKVRETLFQVLNVTEIRVSVGEEEVGLVQMISDLVEAARGRMIAAAAVGFPALILLAMTVLGTVDSAVNEIWQIARRRPFWRRFILFWLILSYSVKLY